jgi:hypothetical protein
MRQIMTEADLFNISVYEWTTAERLLATLRGIFYGDVDRAFAELTNAYYTNVRSARVDWDNFRMGPPREGRINSRQFCQAHPLKWSDDGLVIHHETEPRWVVVFSIADGRRRWPAQRPGNVSEEQMASTPETGAEEATSETGAAISIRQVGAPQTVRPVIKEAVHAAFKAGKITVEELRTLAYKEIMRKCDCKIMDADRDTYKNAVNDVLSELGYRN